MTGRLMPTGDRAILVEPQERAHVREFAARLQRAQCADIQEVVPVQDSVLVVMRPDGDVARLAAFLQRVIEAPLDPIASTSHAAPSVTVPVIYDGPDLETVAKASKLTPDELAAAHSATAWTAAFAGFMPGFCYLVDGDPAIVASRRSEPRPAVPAGSVAVAGPYSAVYPRNAPGGWQILGRTDAPMWDLDRDRPALIVPGCTVRFLPVSVGSGARRVS